MPRSGVTISDVQRAIAALTARNENPSADKIRGFLGYGSKAKILELMAELVPKTDSGSAKLSEALPKELADSLSLVAAKWYAGARDDLQRHLDSAHAALQLEKTQMAEVRAEAVAAEAHCEELEAQLGVARTEAAATKGENATLKDELRRAQRDLATAIGSAASERARADAAASEAKEARRLAAEELNTRIALERETAALQEAARSGRRSQKGS